MNFITIDKNDWAAGIDQLKKTYLVFGPVQDENGCQIKPLAPDLQPEMGAPATVMSPKSVLFPQTEKILTATLDESSKDHHIMKPVDKNDTPRAVLGIRPYDAKAVQLVKLNFDNPDYKDPYWCDAYDITTFVGVGVNRPGPCDFSTSAGCGPFSEQGLDVLMADLDDRYLAKVLTPKGEAWAAACGFDTPADTAESQTLFDILQKEAEKQINTAISTDNLAQKTILDLYEAPFWDDVAFSCINCGTCTFVCPTCWCFDIQDETKHQTAVRFRNWDSCMSPLFTHHASGHNPRESKIHRVRQRFMHKLKYFLDKYDQGIMCVGCGRCVASCPVNIDIREVCNLMNDYQKDK
ncbi:MAG: 4Fe-4S dicluster domain-containing protein [Desulfotignum sp.]|nr:4Fe-4S dicluster domain-containing protein [Desulfotignum sp.]